MSIDQYDDRHLSETLMEAMKVKGLTTEKLALATGVSERIIELLLAERFEELPPAPYLRGYLMKISEALGMDGQELWSAYGKYHREIRRAGYHDTLPTNRFALPQVSRKLIVIATVAVLLAGFVASRFLVSTRNFLFEVNVAEPAVVTTSTYAISGTVRAGDRVSLNGDELAVAAGGTFSATVTLKPGWNDLLFVVRRPLEGEREYRRQIFFEAPTSEIQAL